MFVYTVFNSVLFFYVHTYIQCKKMSSEKKLNCLSVKQKLEIIKEIKEEGKSRKMVATKYHVALCTISRILTHQDKLKEVANANGNVDKKRFKKSNYEIVEKAVSLWFKQNRSNGCAISGPMIMEQAKKFSVQLNVDFDPNPGWLSRWKIKNNVQFYKIQGEKLAADEASASYWTETVLPGLLENYNENDIFNADESALFYKAAPTGTMAYKGDNPSGGKVDKNRITLLFLANMAGSEKEIFAIGKYKQPHCFRGKEVPVKYFHNSKAWMNQNIWTQILTDLNCRMQKKNKNIILFVDNAACHKLVDNYSPSNIKVVFLPANSTSLIQPLDQGIIKAFKVYYRHQIVRKQLLAIEKGLNLNEFYKSLSLLDALKMVKRAWWLVTPTTMKNCFKKARFFKSNVSESQDVVEIEEEVIDLPSDINDELHALTEIDANEQCFGDLSEEDIIQEVLDTTEDNSEITSVEQNNCLQISEATITRKEALKSFDTLRSYFDQNGLCSESIDEIENQLFISLKTKLTQTSITEFLK